MSTTPDDPAPALEPRAERLDDTGTFPNSRLPALVYRGVLSGGNLAARFEALFGRNGWPGASAMGSVDSRLPFEMAVIITATLLWYRTALQLAKKPERFVQTLTAMFATRALIAPVDLPVRLTVFSQMQANTQPSSMLALLFLFLLVWQFVINVRIVRAAFEWPLPAAIIMIIAQEFAVLMVVAALFGNAAAPTP